MVTVSKIPSTVADCWRPLVDQADNWLHGELGRWSQSKNIDWRVLQGPTEKPYFDLLLSEGELAVSDRFDRFELTNEKVFRSRIRDLWGKLLQVTSHATTQRLQHMAEEWQREATVGTD